MMEKSGSWATTLTTALVGLFLAAPATAQQQGSVEAHGGWAFPASNLLDLQDSGPAFGASGTYWITEQFGVRAGGDVQLFSGKEGDDIRNENGITEVPDISTFHYHLGVDLRITPPEATAWDIRLNGGAGGTTVSSDDFPAAATPPEDGPDFSQSYFSLNTGLRVGYAPTESVEFFLLGQGFFAFGDQEDLDAFAQFDLDIDPMQFENVWSVPVQGGIEIVF